jgi:hypothetical protein
LKEKDPDDLYNVLLDALTGKIDVTVTTILVIPDLSLSLLRNSILVTKVENCCTCNGRPTTDRWPFKGIFGLRLFYYYLMLPIFIFIWLVRFVRLPKGSTEKQKFEKKKRERIKKEKT